MHDRLLEALLALADVRLVASYRDERLGFPAPDDLRIFLPDMHLCSKRRRDAYQYGTNQEELLVRTVQAIAAVKANAAAGETVALYQIGDYLDLWREFPNPACGPGVPDRILDDQGALVDALEDRDLNTHFLLGNHDFDLYQWKERFTAWDRRYYLGIGGGSPSVLAMHGDYFDWVENVPERVKDFAVYYFAPLVDPPPIDLGKMNDLSHATHDGRDYATGIQLEQPAVVGTTQSAGIVVPGQWNIQAPGTSGAQFLQLAFAACTKANQQYELQMRVVVIGHTHHARIAKLEGPDGPFVLVDSGAWIERCCEAEGSAPMDNAQVTAISANEIRIYQMIPH